jgi:hypothetical protein
LAALAAIVFAVASSVSVAGSSQSLGGVLLTNVQPRVMTPNGDQRNDVVFFKFDSTLVGFPIEGSILDISGAKVAGLELNLNDTALSWDGREENGQVAPAGVYIYSIKMGHDQATGTIVVAR